MFKILVLEDDKELNRTVCTFLNNSGYEAVGCVNANEAYDALYENMIDIFNKMAEELGSVETLRTDFIANVSHEMKPPLAVMQNYGTLLQTPELSEEKRMEYAKGVTDGSRRMADMTKAHCSYIFRKRGCCWLNN